MHRPYVFVCGGTGGHIYPALAVAEHFDSDQVLFVGSKNRLEKDLLQRVGFAFYAVPVHRKNLGIIFLGLLQSLFLLIRNRPRFVFSTGGYVSFPMVLAAFFLRIPLYLQEQNLLPGKVNRFLSRFARQTFIAYPDSIRYFPKPHLCLLMGNPLRKSLSPVEKKAHAQKTILVMGGSLGAEAIDQAVDPLIKAHPEWNWIHIRAGQYQHEMKQIYAEVDLAICRAGAMSLSELSLWGIPAILIPYPFAAELHQHRNAEYFQKAGAAVLLDQNQLNSKNLDQKIQEIIQSESQLRKMSESMFSLSKPEASSRISALLKKL